MPTDPPEPQPCTGSRDFTVAKGAPVTLCWGTAPSTDILYFRLRGSQTPSGAFNQVARITYSPSMLQQVADPCDPTQSVPWLVVNYTLVPKFTLNYYYWTIVYTHTLTDGTTETLETVGSEQVKVRVTP